MLKVLATPAKKPDWTDDEWFAHYFQRHGPLAASVAPFVARCRQYVQNYARDREEGGPWLPSRGVSELWFDDLPMLIAAFTDPDYIKILRTDEMRFIDLDATMIAICEERPVYERQMPELGDKRWTRDAHDRLFVFRAAKPGTDAATFRKQWSEAAAKIVACPPFQDLVRRFVQSYPIDPSEAGLPGTCGYAAIDEFWFDSETAAIEFSRAWKQQSDLVTLEAELTLPDKAGHMLVHSHMVWTSAGMSNKS